ncbi:MAG: hypothetical protein AMXMBFR58_31910 [Phycisphaerae bacterium]
MKTNSSPSRGRALNIRAGSAARLSGIILLCGAAASAARGQCDPRWYATDGVGGADPAVYCVTVWDRDGEGPLVPMVVIGGVFTQVGSMPAGYIAAWDGTAWSDLGGGVNGTVNSLAVMQTGELVAAGTFTEAGGVPANRIARFDGSAWSAFSTGMNNAVQAVAVLTSGDVVAGGSFSNAGGAAVNRIARWNGSSWSAMGVMNSTVWTLLALDDDRLVAGGQFTYTTSVPANKIAHWNGSAWTGMGVPNNTVLSLGRASNGDVFAGGLFTYVGVFASRIARYSFTTGWSAMAGGINGPVWAIRTLQNGEVVAGGTFLIADGQYINGIARWNGTNWGPMGLGMENPPNVLGLAQLPGGDLYAGGGFSIADGLWSPGLARWATPGAPVIVSQPESTASCPAGPASFVVVAEGEAALEHLWQAELDPGVWSDLADGDLYHGSTRIASVSGATSPTATFTAMEQFRSDRIELAVRCVVTGSCGNVVSNSAVLLVCPADFDCTGFVDTEDFDAFVRAFEAGTDNADFDGSGFVDTDDFDAFVRAFEAGC